tara:strand:+ start:265 stop:2865 length:2601 start_codon:yes stop_codon:yes gene_type:complete
MIQVVIIILFIIFLIYSIRSLNKSETYTIDKLNISWGNKSGVEESVNKWILVLENSDGDELHKIENTDDTNRKNFKPVTIPFIENKEFDQKIFGDNKLKVYYNQKSDNNIVITTNVTFDINDFSAKLSDIKYINRDFSDSINTIDEILGTEGTKIYVYPKGRTKNIYNFINNKTCDINNTNGYARQACFMNVIGFERQYDESNYFLPNFPESGTSYKYFGLTSFNKIILTTKESNPQKFYLEKPSGFTDTDEVKYRQFAYQTTSGTKYYMYVSTNDELKVDEPSNISDTSSTIFEFRYSKDCESYWTNVKEDDDGKKIIGYNVFDCGDDDIHNCQYWGHIRRDASGKGEACPSDMKENNYLIKTQWPKKSTISELNTNFPEYLETEYPDIIAENTDPNKNQMLAITPQYYKNEYDTLNATINSNKAPAAPGQIVYTSSGTFTVPTGVTSISCVVVGGGGGSTGSPGTGEYSGAGGGGGGLAYGTFSVTAGSTVTVQVGAGGSAGTNVNLSTNKAGTGGESKLTYGGTDMLIAYGGSGGAYGTTVDANGGRFSIAGSGVTLSGGGNGGNGGRGRINNGGGGGGGAGGYGDNGGGGANGNYGVGDTGGAGGGGGGQGQTRGGEQNNGGGGVGLDGQGTDGLGGSGNEPGGGGSDGSGGGSGGVGGTYGGGAGGPEDDTNLSGSVGGAGGVRIIWGSDRAYPFTNTTDGGVAVDVDCEGSYENNWSACSATCGEGEQTKKYNITQEPIGSGTACPPLSISQTCNNDCACVPNQAFLNNSYISPASVNVATNKCDQSTDCGKGTSTVLDESNRTNQEDHIINAYLDEYYSGTSLSDLPSYLRRAIVNGIQPWVNEILEKTYSDVCTYKTK